MMYQVIVDSKRFKSPGKATRISLVVNPGSLLPGKRYRFRLSASNGAGLGYADTTVEVNALPRFGTVAVDRVSGDSLDTMFIISAAGWTDDADDLPLRYRFGYRDSVEGDVTWVSPFSPRSRLKTTLPAGAATDAAVSNRTLMLVVAVRDKRGAEAIAIAPAPVVVFANTLERTNPTAFLAHELARIKALQRGGDWVGAVAAAVTSLDVVNTEAFGQVVRAGEDSEFREQITDMLLDVAGNLASLTGDVVTSLVDAALLLATRAANLLSKAKASVPAPGLPSRWPADSLASEPYCQLAWLGLQCGWLGLCFS